MEFYQIEKSSAETGTSEPTVTLSGIFGGGWGWGAPEVEQGESCSICAYTSEKSDSLLYKLQMHSIDRKQTC